MEWVGQHPLRRNLLLRHPEGAGMTDALLGDLKSEFEIKDVGHDVTGVYAGRPRPPICPTTGSGKPAWGPGLHFFSYLYFRVSDLFWFLGPGDVFPPGAFLPHLQLRSSRIPVQPCNPSWCCCTKRPGRTGAYSTVGCMIFQRVAPRAWTVGVIRVRSHTVPL